MSTLDYRSLFTCIVSNIKLWLEKPCEGSNWYLWVHEEEPFGVVVDILATDSPSDNMEYLPLLFDFDKEKDEYYVIENAVHSIVRKWCLRPTAQESHNYTIPEYVTERSLIELCERFRDAICAGAKNGAPEINVRYATDEGSFHLAKFGDYFFFENKMYMFDAKPRWKEAHDAFVTRAFFGDDCQGRGYVHPVAFCGVQTPFKDDKGAPVFTGDICIEKDDPNNFYRVVVAEEREGYGFMGDNHMKLLSMCHKPVHRVGTVFYGLSLDEPIKNLWHESAEISMLREHKKDLEETLKLAKLTPSFTTDPLQKLIISVDNEEYNWRRVFE